MKISRPLIYAVLILFAVFTVCCVLAAGIGVASYVTNLQQVGAHPVYSAPTLSVPTAPVATLSTGAPIIAPTLPPQEPQEPLQPTPQSIVLPTVPAPAPASSSMTQTLATLEDALVPVNDPIDLAERLENKKDLPVSLQAPAKTYQVGDQESFWVTNSDTNENFQVPATLQYITDHVYFWIQDDIRFKQGDLKALVDTFENKIYPTDREFFGSEWTPGVDADPHLYILYARGLGGSVAGYYSSADEYLPVVRQYSNGHEMFLLSSDHVDLGEEFAYSVLAHEFQHMIHWYRDRNEETWMNEGASDLASFLNGYSIGGHDRVFAQDPDIQLNEWPNNATSTVDHYGGSFLFMTYFLDRFGEDATKALVADPANGMVSIDDVLARLGIQDPLTGKQITADDFFMDWLLTNYLQDKDVADGRYTYHNYPAAPDVGPTQKVSSCPADLPANEVHQYGVNYIDIRCKGNYVIHFAGSTQVNVLPDNPHSGNFAFYSNRGDESDMTLTHEFDFTNVSAPLTLSYWTWYDLEKDYDYLYLTASLDGKEWKILTTPSGTDENPSGNSYGWGYNGESGGGPAWIQEDVDISQYAGKKVQFRFEYVTDAAVNGEGFMLDDVAIPQTGYSTDFEADDGGWQADGFVRIENVLPQTYRISLIKIGQDKTVEIIPVGAGNVVDIPIQLGNDLREAVLVVTGTSRFTRQNAVYSLSIQPFQ